MQVGKKAHLSHENVREIRFRVRAGESRVEVARYFGISKNAVDKILWKHTYASVPEGAEDFPPTLEPLTEAEEVEAGEILEEVNQRLIARGLAGIAPASQMEEPSGEVSERLRGYLAPRKKE